MIVPMKKVSLLVMGEKKKQALKILRKLGVVHIEISEGSGSRLLTLKEQISLLERAMFAVGDHAKKSGAAGSAEGKAAKGGAPEAQAVKGKEGKATKGGESETVSGGIGNGRTPEEMLAVAENVEALAEEKKRCYADMARYQNELEQYQTWGEIDPDEIHALAKKGIEISLYEMSPAQFKKLDEAVDVVVLERTKTAVRFLRMEKKSGQVSSGDGSGMEIRTGSENASRVETGAGMEAMGPEAFGNGSKTGTETETSPKHSEEHLEEALKELRACRVELPEISTAQMKQRITALEARLQDIEKEYVSYAACVPDMKQAIAALQKEVEFETYESGMGGALLSGEPETVQEASEKEAIYSGNGSEIAESTPVSIAYLQGYIPAEDMEQLKLTAKENAWGLVAEDPTPDDNVPTELRNNKFVSLVYPLTDFIGTVPGYFEYDISAWFLGFILVFFGIIFGDGGYGLLICGAAAIPIIKALLAKKAPQPTFLLVALLGGATILWGTLTCTWFGLEPEYIPGWLQSLSVPMISNVYADKIWYPFWTNKEAGLTTAQNVQIFCFSLALVQLTVAHIKGAVRNKGTLKMLGDIGAALQLIGIFYVVLSLVVNAEVFGLRLVIGGVPVGTVAIALVGIGFVMNFVFANYETGIGQSVLDSAKNIVSVLLGVVNVFSDIVSYIRLWAVGLAGAAISSTVNELASPMLGNFLMMIFAIIILVFGHGLNMILNVLSVVVHGIRLNTLEFSSHLDMSWSGHKYNPFEE